jgi:hypothetical protein
MGQKHKKRERAAAAKRERIDQGNPNDRDLGEILANLTTEEAEMFLAALELTMRKRRVQLLGYLATLVLLLFGILWAFWMYGNRDPDQFIGWVFLIPPAAAGLSLYLFGRMSRSLKPSREIILPKKVPAERARKKAAGDEEE